MTDDLKLIRAIADRAVALYGKLGALGPSDDLSSAQIGIADELLTVHHDIVPLRLAELLAADDGNFAHDIAGIHRHLEHDAASKAAHLTDGFYPRFAKTI